MRLLTAISAKFNVLTIIVESMEDAPEEVRQHEWLNQEWREISNAEVLDAVQSRGYFLATSDPEILKLGSLVAVLGRRGMLKR